MNIGCTQFSYFIQILCLCYYINSIEKESNCEINSEMLEFRITIYPKKGRYDKICGGAEIKIYFKTGSMYMGILQRQTSALAPHVL